MTEKNELTIPTQKERSDAAKFLGSLGGKASVKSRFSGMTKEEISKKMSEVRMKKISDGFLDGLNKAKKQKEQF